MKRLLHISDPHFGTVQLPVMEALVTMAREQRPDVLVLSGDITQRARPDQFRQARAFCDRLGIAHMLALPGNHDIPLFDVGQRLFSPYARYLRAFGPDLEPSLQMPWLQVTGVNTTRPWRHKNGEISAAQIARVVDRLVLALPGQVRLVVVHQPVYVLRPQDVHDRLRGWEAAVRAWAAAGADIVMGGHIHLPYACELSAHVVGLGRRLWCVQAGTALSSRVRWEAPNSVNLLHCNGERALPHCRLERWDYGLTKTGAGRFAVVSSGEFALDRKAAA